MGSSIFRDHLTAARAALLRRDPAAAVIHLRAARDRLEKIPSRTTRSKFSRCIERALVFARAASLVPTDA